MASAQDSILLNSKYEQFSYQPGRMIKNTDSATGHLDDMWFYHSTATDIQDGATIQSLYIRQSGFNYNNSLILDMDEIGPVSQALDYCRSRAANDAQTNSRYRFITNGDMEVTLYFDQKWLFLIQKIYHGSNARGVPGNVVVVTEKEIEKFMAELKRAS